MEERGMNEIYYDTNLDCIVFTPSEDTLADVFSDYLGLNPNEISMGDVASRAIHYLYEEGALDAFDGEIDEDFMEELEDLVLDDIIDEDDIEEAMAGINTLQAVVLFYEKNGVKFPRFYVFGELDVFDERAVVEDLIAFQDGLDGKKPKANTLFDVVYKDMNDAIKDSAYLPDTFVTKIENDYKTTKIRTSTLIKDKSGYHLVLGKGYRDSYMPSRYGDFGPISVCTVAKLKESGVVILQKDALATLRRLKKGKV